MLDEEIVKLIQKGETDKFGLIIDRYQGKLFWYVKRLINQRDEEVEDVVEEVLIKAYQNLQGFETNRKFSSWIYRIAHNQAIDYFKKRKVKAMNIEDKEEILETREELLEDLEIEKEQKKKILKAVESLELKYKEVVVLTYYEDKSYEEIAEVMRVPTSQVGVLLFRAKKKLKEKLKNE